MISFQEALSAVLDKAHPTGVQTIPLLDAVGYFLAKPVTAPFDVPRFENSAVDGFGVRVSDTAEATPETPVRMKLAAVIKAGDAGETTVVPGSAVKILTGAPVPEGVEAVVMKEFCSESNGCVYITKPARPGENIRKKAEEFTMGDLVLPAGVQVTPPVVGLLASFGAADAVVYKKPEVAVITTGNELVEPGTELESGQIYDSNFYSLAAALLGIGIEKLSITRVPDEPGMIRDQLISTLDAFDIVITVGGISVGDYDFIKDVCESLGVKSSFHSIAMKPGKPNYFATYEQADKKVRLVFGLPGNPVAAILSFHQLVRPVVLKMMGAERIAHELMKAKLQEDLRKKQGRMEFVRGWVRFAEGFPIVQPTSGQDSHMLGGLALANCLIHFPAEAESIRSGETVDVEMLEWW